MGGPALLVAIFLWALGARIASAIDATIVSGRDDAQRAVWWVVAIGAVGFFLGGRGVALANRKFVIESFRIPSGGMLPTLLIGDQFFVDKLVLRTRNPLRGELIAFEFPDNRAQIFVKRVIGLPGDQVEMRGGRLLLNGKELPRCKLGKTTRPRTSRLSDSALASCLTPR